MLSGVCIELRHGSEIARAVVRAHLATHHATVLEASIPGSAIIVDLDACHPCPGRCGAKGILVMVENAEGMRISIQVPGERMAEDLVPAILQVARGAHILPSLPGAMLMVPQEPCLLLSGRERQVAQGVLDGKPNKVIARDLGITETTVKVHMKSILRKTGMANRTQTAIWALRNLH